MQQPASVDDTLADASASVAPSHVSTPGPRPAVNGTPPTGQAPSNPTLQAQQSPSHQNSNAPSSVPAIKSINPVIQMLADRAGTDPDLKALMRLVAHGEASTKELKKLQSYIDEFTRLLRSGQAASRPPPPATARPVNKRQVLSPALNVRRALALLAS
jgi:hypothetical protein